MSQLYFSYVSFYLVYFCYKNKIIYFLPSFVLTINFCKVKQRRHKQTPMLESTLRFSLDDYYTTLYMALIFGYFQTGHACDVKFWHLLYFLAKKISLKRWQSIRQVTKWKYWRWIYADNLVPNRQTKKTKKKPKLIHNQQKYVYSRLMQWWTSYFNFLSLKDWQSR